MFSVATGHIIITPTHPVPLAGFADRVQNYDSISDDLEINLIVIKECDKYYLLYSVDTLFVPEGFVSELITNIGNKWSIKEEQIWMCASHTHFAPSLDKEKPHLGHCDSGYYSHVQEQLLALTISVLSGTFTNAYIQYTSGDANLNINRRKRLLRTEKSRLLWKTLMLPNHSGRKDTTLHLFNFISESGNSLGVLWSYACHPVHAFKRNSVSAEYIGAIRNRLREQFNDTRLTVGFFQGFAGNIKADITTVTHTKFSDQVRYCLQLWPKYTRFPSEDAYQGWIGLLWNNVQRILHSDVQKQVESGIHTSIHKEPLGNVIGETDERQLIFKRLAFGKELTFLSISAEVVTEYTDLLRKSFPDQVIVATAYTDATRIYLPVDSMLSEKGYEVEGFKALFSINGEFKPSLNKKISAAIEALK